jgi:hypothetical protein
VYSVLVEMNPVQSCSVLCSSGNESSRVVVYSVLVEMNPVQSCSGNESSTEL